MATRKYILVLLCIALSQGALARRHGEEVSESGRGAQGQQGQGGYGQMGPYGPYGQPPYGYPPQGGGNSMMGMMGMMNGMNQNNNNGESRKNAEKPLEMFKEFDEKQTERNESSNETTKEMQDSWNEQISKPPEKDDPALVERLVESEKEMREGFTGSFADSDHLKELAEISAKRAEIAMQTAQQNILKLAPQGNTVAPHPTMTIADKIKAATGASNLIGGNPLQIASAHPINGALQVPTATNQKHSVPGRIEQPEQRAAVSDENVSRATDRAPSFIVSSSVGGPTNSLTPDFFDKKLAVTPEAAKPQTSRGARGSLLRSATTKP